MYSVQFMTKCITGSLTCHAIETLVTYCCIFVVVQTFASKTLSHCESLSYRYLTLQPRTGELDRKRQFLTMNWQRLITLGWLKLMQTKNSNEVTLHEGVRTWHTYMYPHHTPVMFLIDQSPFTWLVRNVEHGARTRHRIWTGYLGLTLSPGLKLA